MRPLSHRRGLKKKTSLWQLRVIKALFYIFDRIMAMCGACKCASQPSNQPNRYGI